MPSIPLLLLLVIFLSPAPPVRADFMQALSVEGRAVVSQAELYEVKAQPGLLVSLRNRLELTDFLAVTAAAGLHSVGRSNLVGGYAYRGYLGLGLGLGLEFMPGEKRPGGLRPGGFLGGEAYFVQYANTQLLFFFPALSAGFVLEYRLSDPAWLALRWEVPLSWYLRRDFAWSAGLGTAVAVAVDYGELFRQLAKERAAGGRRR
jgi:hypothetical protein